MSYYCWTCNEQSYAYIFGYPCKKFHILIKILTIIFINKIIGLGVINHHNYKRVLYLYINFTDILIIGYTFYIFLYEPLSLNKK